MRGKYVVLCLAVLTIGALGALIGCSDDIILEPLPSLLGDYVGEYSFSVNQQTRTAAISVRFTEQTYLLDDTTDTFCSPRGDYALGNTVEFTENIPGCAGVVANEDWNPRGQFSLRQPGDSVVLIQQVGDTLKQLLLLRTS